jgi:BirA family biotin operon repressor/biotin-[acetyl-CoA-carboxylase] ligase
MVFALAEEGAADRTVVVADFQALGRGRRGRVWQAEPGMSLLTSILVRPTLPPPLLPTLSLATAVAVAEALAAVAGLDVRLKWPNDVVVSGRKLAGILLESRLGAATVAAVGVGINLAQRSFPPPLAGRATSVLLETGRPVDRDLLLTRLLETFDAWRDRLEREGFGPVRARWTALSDTLGRAVAYEQGEGRAVELDVDGALVIDDGRGRRRLLAGEVTHAGETGGRAAAPVGAEPRVGTR